MARGEKIATSLLGHGILFDKMPNAELSEKRGIIRSVRTHNGEVIYTIELLDTGKLEDWLGNNYFRLIQPGVPPPRQLPDYRGQLKPPPEEWGRP